MKSVIVAGVAVLALASSAFAGGMGSKPMKGLGQSNVNLSFQGGSNGSSVTQIPVNLNLQGLGATGGAGGSGGSALGLQIPVAISGADADGSASAPSHGHKPSAGTPVSASSSASAHAGQSVTAGNGAAGGAASVNAPVSQSIHLAPVTVNQGVSNVNGTVQSNSAK